MGTPAHLQIVLDHIAAAFPGPRASGDIRLSTYRASILGDAELYAGIEHLREKLLVRNGIEARRPPAVREALRDRLRTETVFANRMVFAAMLIGERRLDGLKALKRTRAVAARFAPMRGAA